MAMNSMCAWAEEYGLDWEAVAGLSYKSWFELVTILSVAGYCLVALVIYFNNELKVHPMRLLFYLSIFDAALCFNVFSSRFLCKFKLH
jgi:hypothetical protein